MSIPIALVGLLADKVIEYLDRQTVDREPTDEEIQMAGDARRVQAAVAQAKADAAAGGD